MDQETKKRRRRKVHPMLMTAKVISSIFHPAYYPLVCLAVLFYSTFLEYMGLPNMIGILCLTAMFTLFIPTLLTYIYRTVFRISPQKMLHRHERFIPYVLHLVCYLILLHIMQIIRVHGLVLDVIIVSILIQICCTLINCFWKVSMHAAGAGGAIGFLIAHGAILSVSPASSVIPVIIATLICGVVGTSRLILRRHTLAQVNVGTLIGILCGISGPILTYFRIILG